MRNFVYLSINGKPVTVSARESFLTLAEFLRERRLTGTKIACAEGDCGACCVIKAAFPHQGTQAKPQFKVINSCIAFVFQLDCTHIITIEGLKSDKNLSIVQESFINHNASQCGFCTPGFINAVTCLIESTSIINQALIRKALAGNLCRCTGYDNIIKAVTAIDKKKYDSIRSLYPGKINQSSFSESIKTPIQMTTTDTSLYAPISLKEAADWKKQHPQAVIVGGGTDLGVLSNKGKWHPTELLSLHLLRELNTIEKQGDTLHIGTNVTVSDFQDFIKSDFPELDLFLDQFAGPPIKNMATVIGNVANASPIGDLFPFLFVMDAKLELLGSNGGRTIPITKYFKGYKETVLQKHELITKLLIPLPKRKPILKLYKIARREQLDISCVNAAILFQLDKQVIQSIKLCYGGVGPTPMLLPKTAKYLTGKPFTQHYFHEAMALVEEEVSPISDVRGSKAYRSQLARNLLLKAFIDIQTNL